MSFYKSGIKEIVAETVFDAITDAIADLHEDGGNAKIVMRYQITRTLSKS
ncbi:hypothetical protein P7H22_11830 [Paenibacillus larvae]|nr:hypothetical protein [Paenibacillus larvae]MDT2240905.1 hypothetical protein [Paenibacillus larvae]